MRSEDRYGYLRILLGALNRFRVTRLIDEPSQDFERRRALH
jgi:hypothetical protein